MKLKDKIKSYSFWVSLASALILILKVLGSRFGFTIDESMVSDIFTAICSILVLLGIIVIPQAPNTNEDGNLDSNKIEENIKQNEAENQNTNEKESIISDENLNKLTKTCDEIYKQNTDNLENQTNNNLKHDDNIPKNQDIEINSINNSNNGEITNKNFEDIENNNSTQPNNLVVNEKP